ncbi:MAG TPA: NHLP-related RiPP peptide, partial [Gammaproteobacteria bacterium]|nr:NHLP-related RiPP peptide [Gammaproteobacteria bacterium]
LAQLCGELTAEELRVAAPFRCLGVERLASKKQIAAARSELQRYLTSKGGYTIPHCLDASAMRSTS